MPDLFKTNTAAATAVNAKIPFANAKPQSATGGAAAAMGLGRIAQYKRNNLNLSAGIRIVMTVAVSFLCLYLSNYWALGVVFLVSAAYLAAEVKLSLIWKVYLLLAVFAGIAILFLLLLFQIFPLIGISGGGGGHGGSMGGMSAAKQSLSIIAPFLRMAVMLNMVLAMGMNTSLTGLTNTLNRAYLPGFLKLPLIVLVRFVPTFFSDIRQLREAVRIRFRGQSNFWFWLRHPVLWSRILCMPLVVRLIRSGDELAVASELKGLSTKTRFGETGFAPTKNDCKAITILVLTCAVALGVQYYMVKYA